MKRPGLSTNIDLGGQIAPGAMKERQAREGYVRLNKCHTFAWSRSLWADAVKQTGRIAFVFVVAYLVMGYYLLAYNSGLRGVDCWYFLAATLTTVGFGDYYPETEAARGLAIVLLPFGLIVISFGISIAVAQANATSELLPSDKRAAEAKAAAELKAQEEAMAAQQGEEPNAEKSRDVRSLEEQEKALAESPNGRSAVSPQVLDTQKSAVLPDKNGTAFPEYPSQSKDAGSWDAFKKTRKYEVCKLLAIYCGMILFGAIMLLANTDEQHLQKTMTNDGDLTLIDALYLSTVTACTIGYGHIITPLSGFIKGFFIVYMFVSTYVVGQIIGELSGLHISIKEDAITAVLIDSTTWVHKADIDRDGKITEADYVLFKLQQMQKVDLEMLDRLLARFRELDVMQEGALDIGIDVPSASQVEEMQRVVKATGQTLPKLWLQIQSEVVKQADSHDDVEKDGEKINDTEPYVKLNECHDFKWSRTLWSKAARETGRLAGVLVVGYLIFIYACMASLDGLTGLDCWYYIVATITTVGFGDFAPQSQGARAASLVFMPMGLVIIGFGISYVTASNRARPGQIGQSNGGMSNMGGVGASMLNALSPLRMALALQDERNNSDCAGGRSISESAATSEALTASEAAAALARKELGPSGEKKQVVDKEPAFMKWVAVLGKAAWLLLKLTTVVMVGSCFFKFYKPEDEALELTWVDACYFAMVCATSIGYGDITPQTDGGKIFMLFYMLVSTVLVAGILGEFIDLYVCDIVGEGIIEQIIDSTIWVHKADLDGDGKVTEADYVLFKLQQMQKVDLQTLDILIDRFEELDAQHDGALDIGIDVPSADDVKEMHEKLKKLKEDGETRTIVELWQDEKPSAQDVTEMQEKIKQGDPRTLVEIWKEEKGERQEEKKKRQQGAAIYANAAIGVKGTYAEVVAQLEAKSKRSVLAQKLQEIRGRAPSASDGVKFMRRASGVGGGDKQASPEPDHHVEMVNPMKGGGEPRSSV